MLRTVRNLLFILVTGQLALLSCDAPEPKTRLDLASGNGLTAGNRTVSAGEITSTSVYGRTASGADKFKKFRITVQYDTTINPVFTYLDSTFEDEEFGYYFTFGTRGIAGKEYWTFTLEDIKGTKYTKQFIIKTTSQNARQQFNTFSSYFYDLNNRENLRYFSTNTGTPFPGYIGRTTVPASVFQKDLSFAFRKNANSTVDLLSANGTSFKPTSLTPENFNSINTIANLVAPYNSGGGTTTAIIPVQKNQVIAFKTGSDKTGLIRIGTFEKAFDGTSKDSVLMRVRYNVKVLR